MKRSSPTWSPTFVELSADADHALPDSDQVSQRGAAAVRRAADQRIHHERRLQLRRLDRRRSTTATKRCMPRTAASSTAAASIICPSRPRAARSAATPATNSWFRPKTARTRCCTAWRADTRRTRRRRRSAARDLVAAGHPAAAVGEGPHARAPRRSSRSASSSAAKTQQMIKTLIYLADGKPIAVLLRGDHDANEGSSAARPPRRSSNWPTRRRSSGSPARRWALPGRSA